MLCEMCPQPSSRTCSSCESSRYCSRKCGRRAKTQHKLLCATYRTFSDANRPSLLHRRAIYFAVDEAQPRFIWLPFNQEYEEDYEAMYDSPVRGDLLGQNTSMQLIPIRENESLHRKLADTISIMIREAGLVDGSAMNRSVLSVLKTSLQAQHYWAGPIIVYGEKGTTMDPFESRDIDMADFRHFTDAFNLKTAAIAKYNAAQGAPAIFVPQHTQMPSDDNAKATLEKSETETNIPDPENKQAEEQKPTITMVPAIRINCAMEVTPTHPKYEPILLPFNHPIFSRLPTSDISRIIKMPLITYLPLDSGHLQPHSKNASYDATNPEVAYLNVKCLSQSGPSGTLLLGRNRDDEVGSAIVARQDKEALLPEHVEALVTWSRFKVFPVLDHPMGTMSEEQDRRRQVSREKFRYYYDGWAAGKGLAETGPGNPCEGEGRGEDVLRVGTIVSHREMWSYVGLSVLSAVLWFALLLAIREAFRMLLWYLERIQEVFSIVDRILRYVKTG
jgi:hypothetical protein